MKKIYILIVITFLGFKANSQCSGNLFAAFNNTINCKGNATQFTDLSTTTSGTIVSWSWDFGDGNSDNSQNPYYTYLNAGTFNVILIINNSIGCADTITQPVQVYYNPIPSFIQSDVCFGDTMFFNNTSSVDNSTSISTYLWIFGDGSPNSNLQNLNHFYSNAGTYTATLLATTIDGCSIAMNTSVKVFDSPTAIFIFSNSCLFDSAIFTNTSLDPTMGSTQNWSWNFGDGTPLNNTVWDVSHVYGASGNYQVTLITHSSNLGCPDTLQETITVFPQPVANYDFTDICLNESMNFYDSSLVSNGSITSWSWDFGDGNWSTFQNPIYTYSYSGTYVVTLIITTNNGCKDTIAKSVVVHPLPNVLYSTTNVCDGASVQFTDLSSIASTDTIQNYLWNFGDGTAVNNNQNTTHLYNTTGGYTVQLMVVSNFGCADSLSDVSTVNPNPLVNFTANDTFGCQPLCASFQNLSSIVTGSNTQWAWGFGNGDSTNWQVSDECYINPSDSSVHFTVSLTVTSDSGCVTTLSKNNYITVDNSICPSVVWPGDADNNTIVNNNDLLPIGLYYGQTGVPRANISNIWQADSAGNWGYTANNGSDMKRVDCNGDGTINVNDTLAINLNFNLAHSITTTGDTPDNERAAYDLYFVTNGSLFNAGDWVNAELWLGSPSSPITNFYGIAFNINYDASIVQHGTESITYPASWLGTPGTDAIKINKVDATVNTAYGAITRIDHSDVSGYGKIADFKFRIKTTLTSAVAIPLYISNYLAYNSAGIEQTFTTSITKINTGSGISIYPNPFTSQTTIEFNEYQKDITIKIMDVLGKEVKTVNFTGKQFLLEKGEMKKGIYFVQVTGVSGNVVNRKIIIQ